jgi:hypothetical protein
MVDEESHLKRERERTTASKRQWNGMSTQDIATQKQESLANLSIVTHAQPADFWEETD